MGKNVNQLRKLKTEMEQNSISLKKFLINYCGINNPQLMNKKIKHEDIKYLLPNLVRVSYESLLDDNKKIYNSDIILVKDSYGKIVPYENPRLYNYNDIYSETFNYTEEDRKKEEINIPKNLSIYELSKLCKKFKSQKRFDEYKEAHGLLKIRINKDVKEYKYQKRIVGERGREEYEEYKRR